MTVVTGSIPGTRGDHRCRKSFLLTRYVSSSVFRGVRCLFITVKIQIEKTTNPGRRFKIFVFIRTLILLWIEREKYIFIEDLQTVQSYVLGRSEKNRVIFEYNVAISLQFSKGPKK